MQHSYERQRESRYSVVSSEPVKAVECAGFKVQNRGLSRLNGPDAYGLKIDTFPKPGIDRKRVS
jgi:hypothetical protein